MNGKEQIIQKILDDANAQYEKAVTDAKSKADEQLKLAGEKAQEILDDAKRISSETAQSILTKKATVAQIDSKKAELVFKQKTIDEVYETALNKLTKMKKADYLKFIEKRLNKFASKNDVVVISESSPISEEDVSGLAVCQKLSLAVKKTGKFLGGLVLETPVCDKNLTFEATVEEYKKDTVASVAQKLFG